MIKEDKSRVTFNLNGTSQTVFTSHIRRFSEVLREDLGLKGTKVGCDAGDCGACTIQINGEQRYACLTATGQLDGSDVRTVEGLSKNGELSALQQSFLEEGAAQCGICTPGMLMAAKSLLDQVHNPSEEQVLEALSGVLCRCTGYTKIVKAVINSVQKQTSISFPDAGNAVGSRMVKVDGQKKLSGEELFGADKAPEGSLWLRTIRS
ncbi:MAG: (2Fe-2S)-binding protein, partial [SAR324 cluster bacterium]|nr:(2Fe-2S)-binding protein [SAR324 cluster bacterium]